MPVSFAGEPRPFFSTTSDRSRGAVSEARSNFAVLLIQAMDVGNQVSIRVHPSFQALRRRGPAQNDYYNVYGARTCGGRRLRRKAYQPGG